MQKFTRDEFIDRAILIHGDKYDYSKLTYVSAREDVEIICPTHGAFFQKAFRHLSGRGCQKCGHAVGAEKRTKNK